MPVEFAQVDRGLPRIPLEADLNNCNIYDCDSTTIIVVSPTWIGPNQIKHMSAGLAN